MGGSFMVMSRLRGLIAIQQAIGAAVDDLAAVMNAIASDSSVMPAADGVTILLREGEMMRTVASNGTAAHLIGLQFPVAGSLSGLCILTGEPQRSDDAPNDARLNHSVPHPLGMQSMIVLPILYKGMPQGVLLYHSARPGAFSDEDMLFARLLAAPIASGLSKVAQADAERVQNALRELVCLKDQLVSTVSHELRTPLTSISGSLGLLDGGAAGALPESARGLISVAKRNAERLKTLVNDLLDMDRVDSGRLGLQVEPVDLVEAIRDAFEANEPFARNLGIELVADLPSMPLIVVTDSDRLAQVITNLLSNAAKFSPAGSPVTLSLDRAGPNARIRVADQGPGIPAEFRAHLFDRFTQSVHTRRLSSQPGTGLGLAIARGIVEQLGGSIRLDDEVSCGATFEVLLPLESVSAEAASVALTI